MKRLFFFTFAAIFVGAVQAKLPAPSPEAQPEAAEAKAKANWSGKVAAFQLCKAQDRAAAAYYKAAKVAGRNVPAAASVPPCVDPGPFVYNPEATTAAPVPAAPVVAGGKKS